MPEELWMEVCEITRGDDQDHPQEKEIQKRLSEETLQIAEEKRETKGKGEKEIKCIIYS